MKIKKAILAGIVVSIVGYNYLLNYDVLSKIVFSVALIIILTMNLNLFTSKVAIILCSELDTGSKIKDISVIFLGNAIACLFFGFLFSFLGETHAEEIWEAKMQTNLFIALYKAIVVGFLMQIAATCRHDLVTVGVVLLFIGTGGEHSIANIVYMSVARAFSFKAVFYILICAIGNAIGGLIIYLLNREKNLVS